MAIEILVARTDIRTVLTDVDMPGSMDGLKLAEAIHGRWPLIEIIVMCEKRKLVKADLSERSHFFTNPYDHDAMIAVLHSFAALISGRDVLDQSATCCERRDCG